MLSIKHQLEKYSSLNDYMVDCLPIYPGICLHCINKTTTKKTKERKEKKKEKKEKEKKKRKEQRKKEGRKEGNLEVQHELTEPGN